MMTCGLCLGAQNLFCRQKDGGYEWYVCPACGGAGTRFLHCAPTISQGRAQDRFLRPAPEMKVKEAIE